MPAKEEVRSPGRYVGMIVLGVGAVLILIAAILVSASGLGFFSQRLTVTTYFDDADGLKTGAAVNINGVTVGTVKSVTISTAPERKKTPVQVTMKLDPEFKDSLHTDSLAELVNLGALADTVVDIDSEHATGPPLQDGDELKTLNTPSILDMKAGQETVKALNATEDRLDTVVDQIASGKGTIGQFMSNPSLPNQAIATAAKVQAVTAKLGSDSNSAGKFINGHSVGDKFTSIGNNVQGISASYTKLANGPLQANVASVGTHANSITADVNAGKGGVGEVMKNPKQLTDTLAQANTLISNYAKNPGTGGNFAVGGATAVDLKKFQAETSALATMMRTNPKQYFTIQFRLF